MRISKGALERRTRRHSFLVVHFRQRPRATAVGAPRRGCAARACVQEARHRCVRAPRRRGSEQGRSKRSGGPCGQSQLVEGLVEAAPASATTTTTGQWSLCAARGQRRGSSRSRACSAQRVADRARAARRSRWRSCMSKRRGAAMCMVGIEATSRSPSKRRRRRRTRVGLVARRAKSDGGERPKPTRLEALVRGRARPEAGPRCASARQRASTPYGLASSRLLRRGPEDGEVSQGCGAASGSSGGIFDSTAAARWLGRPSPECARWRRGCDNGLTARHARAVDHGSVSSARSRRVRAAARGGGGGSGSGSSVAVAVTAGSGSGERRRRQQQQQYHREPTGGGIIASRPTGIIASRPTGTRSRSGGGPRPGAAVGGVGWDVRGRGASAARLLRQFAARTGTAFLHGINGNVSEDDDGSRRGCARGGAEAWATAGAARRRHVARRFASLARNCCSRRSPTAAAARSPPPRPRGRSRGSGPRSAGDARGCVLSRSSPKPAARRAENYAAAASADGGPKLSISTRFSAPGGGSRGKSPRARPSVTTASPGRCRTCAPTGCGFARADAFPLELPPAGDATRGRPSRRRCRAGTTARRVRTRRGGFERGATCAEEDNAATRRNRSVGAGDQPVTGGGSRRSRWGRRRAPSGPFWRIGTCPGAHSESA